MADEGILLFGPSAHAAAEAKVHVWVESREGNFPVLNYSRDPSACRPRGGWRLHDNDDDDGYLLSERDTERFVASLHGAKKKEDREEESVFPRAENLDEFFGSAKVAAQRDGDWETVVAKVFSALDRGSNVALCGEGEDTLALALLVSTADDSKLDRVAECWREVVAATRGETSAGIDGLFEYDLQYVGKTQGRVPPSSMASLRLLVE